jgi:hypothetical protein
MQKSVEKLLYPTAAVTHSVSEGTEIFVIVQLHLVKM